MQILTRFPFLFYNVYACSSFISIKSNFVSAHLYLILLCAIFAVSTKTCKYEPDYIPLVAVGRFRLPA